MTAIARLTAQKTAPVGIALLVLLAAAGAGCSGYQVVREGEGWREVASGGPPPQESWSDGTPSNSTQIEITTADPQVIGNLAKTHPNPRVRAEALKRLADQAALAHIARNEKEVRLRRAAVERLGDAEVLRDIAKTDSDPGVRQLAMDRADVLRTIGGRHPEYKGWTACIAGAWVKMDVELKEGDARSRIQIVRSLLDPPGEKLTLEQKVVSTGKGLEGRSRSMVAQLDRGVALREQGDEEIELGGRKVSYRYAKFIAERERMIIRVKIWFRDDIPGGVARMEIEESPEGAPLRLLRATATSWGGSR